MKVIGITGGVGAGKSEVLQYVQEKWEAYVCYADRIGHILQQPEEVCYQKIVDFFGKQILDDEQKIERAKLAEIVFADAEKRVVLNHLMHPYIKERIRSLIQIERDAGRKYFLLEAALLIEDGYGQICDELWYVHAPREIRKERLKQTRGYTEEKIKNIFSSQLTEETYRANCKYVIDNSKTLDNMYKQIDMLENRQNETM